METGEAPALTPPPPPPPNPNPNTTPTPTPTPTPNPAGLEIPKPEAPPSKKSTPTPNPAGLEIPKPEAPPSKKSTPKKKMRHTASRFGGEKVDEVFTCSICGYTLPLFDMEEHYEMCAALLQ